MNHGHHHDHSVHPGHDDARGCCNCALLPAVVNVEWLAENLIKTYLQACF
jgi:hypothetical protein